MGSPLGCLFGDCGCSGARATRGQPWQSCSNRRVSCSDFMWGCSHVSHAALKTEDGDFRIVWNTAFPAMCNVSAPDLMQYGITANADGRVSGDEIQLLYTSPGEIGRWPYKVHAPRRNWFENFGHLSADALVQRLGERERRTSEVRRAQAEVSSAMKAGIIDV